MLKKISALFFLSMAVSAPLLAETAPKYDIVVPRDYKTVGEAVEHAMPGDSIAIGEGTFEEKEGIKLKTDMKLIGAGADKTVLKIGGEGIMALRRDNDINNIAVKDLNLIFDNQGLHVSCVNGFTISRCVLTSGSRLALLEVDSSVNVKVLNCTFANSEPGMIIGGAPVEVAVRNSIFYNNGLGLGVVPPEVMYDTRMPAPTKQANLPPAGTTLALAYNDFYDIKDFENCQKGETDITVNPGFVAPKEGDFHLNGDSPCINAGDPDPKYNDSDGSRNDMGALPYSKGKPALRPMAAAIETLKAAKVIQGIEFPAGTRVEFYGSGKISLAELVNDEKIQDIDFAKSTRLLFYETGKIRVTVLRRAQNIQGIPCIGDAYFYKSGKLRDAALSQDKEVQGLPFTKGSRISLLQSGKLHGGTLGEAGKVQGMEFPKGTAIYFSDSGKLFVVYLSKGQDIQGLSFAAGKVFFLESGKVSRGVLAREAEINGIKIPNGSGIELYSSGRLKNLLPSKEIEIQGVKFKAGNMASFSGDGMLIL